MTRRIPLTAIGLALVVSGCSGETGPVAASTDTTTRAQTIATPEPTPTPTFARTTFTGSPPGPEDKDPQVLLDYFKGAIEAGDEIAASEAWFEGKAPVDMNGIGTSSVTVTYGEGRQEGAAGSSYFTVPVTVTAPGTDGYAIPRTGTLPAKRVNDVPGSSPEQLSWRIRSLKWD